MVLKSMISKIPFTGNLVNVKYLIGKKTDKVCMFRIMTAKSANIKSVGPNGEISSSSMIVTESELFEAKARFYKYCEEVAKQKLDSISTGHMIKKVFKKTTGNRLPADYYLVYLHDESITYRTGFMFTQSEIDDIKSRTERIPETVAKVSFLQKLVLFISRQLNKFPSEK